MHNFYSDQLVDPQPMDWPMEDPMLVAFRSWITMCLYNCKTRKKISVMAFNHQNTVLWFLLVFMTDLENSWDLVYKLPLPYWSTKTADVSKPSVLLSLNPIHNGRGPGKSRWVDLATLTTCWNSNSFVIAANSPPSAAQWSLAASKVFSK